MIFQNELAKQPLHTAIDAHAHSGSLFYILFAIPDIAHKHRMGTTLAYRHKMLMNDELAMA